MPFRAKVKRAFGRLSVSEEGSDLAKTTTTASKKEKKQKTPKNVYRPGEAMPKPKYRGPVNEEHQEQLRAFSFGNALGRRDSGQSLYSPMGSRLPSRRGSFLNQFGFGSKSRRQSHRDPALQESREGDDDVANVGLSKQHTREEDRRSQPGDDTSVAPLREAQTITNGNMNGHANGSTYSRPFTDDELSRAMTKTTLRENEPTKA